MYIFYTKSIIEDNIQILKFITSEITLLTVINYSRLTVC